MRIIVSDVTYMSSEICVAGWCSEERRMVRPLSGVGHHWPKAYAGNPFSMGMVVEVTPTGATNTRGLPHISEDLIVSQGVRAIGAIPENEIAESLADSESNSIDDLFGGNLQRGKFVAAGTNCPSLGAISIDTQRLTFFENTRLNRPPQLRCRFFDGAGGFFDFPISAINLRDDWKEGGLELLNDKYSGVGVAHIRIGLAHPFEDTGQAYAMVNGIALYMH